MPYLNNDVLKTLITDKTAGLINGPGGDEVMFKDSKGLKTGKYPKDRIVKMIAASKAYGVNPLTALSIAIQENAFGKGAGKSATTEATKGRRNRGGLGNVSNEALNDKDNQMINDLVNKGYDYDSLKLVAALKNKMAYAKQLGFTDPAAQLQSYNGYGKLTPALFGGSTKAYGVDITNGVDLKKNPLYGKRILQLQADLQGNKDLAALLTK